MREGLVRTAIEDKVRGYREGEIRKGVIIW